MKAQMVNYSTAFTNADTAMYWAARQLPLVSKHGSKLYVEKRSKYGFYVWRTMTPRDSEPIFRDHQGMKKTIRAWMASDAFQVMDTAKLVEVA